MRDRPHPRGRPPEVVLEPLNDTEYQRTRRSDGEQACNALLDLLRKHHPERDGCTTG
jgi:hypothetical protein